MKKILTIGAFLLAMMPAVAQTAFTVKGKAHEGTKSLMMGDMSGFTNAETVEVKDGQFTITGSKSNQTVMMLYDRTHNVQRYFIVDGSEITLDMGTGEVKGSVLNEKLSAMMQQLNQAKNEDQTDSILQANLAANKDNVIAAFALAVSYYRMSYEELKNTIDAGGAYLQHPMCSQAKETLKSLEKRAPGRMFIDLTENDTTGVAHRLSEYVGKGKYVLVDFWASWCGPCMQEMPNVKANYEKYRKMGFNVVGLSFDRSADAWKRAIRENHLDWVHLSDLKFWQSVAAEVYTIHSIPSSILVDPTGKIVAVDLRGDRLGKKLAEIYGY